MIFDSLRGVAIQNSVSINSVVPCSLFPVPCSLRCTELVEVFPDHY
ncbi:MAG: hypothetical protein ACK57T_23310 [Dolichospermum sp.]